MKMQRITLPILPLSQFLLPGGITRLRIFEQHYLKMISIASKGQGFVIQLKHKQAKLSGQAWGSWVEIVNFAQGEDGVLEVDVKCKSLVEIHSISRDLDNLSHGEVNALEHWSKATTEPLIDQLSDALDQVIENNYILRELYTEVATDNPNWVVARWLEILPVQLTHKNVFIDKYTFEESKKFVEAVIYK